MPVGVLAAVLAVVLGGILGTLLRKLVSKQFCEGLMTTIAIASLGMGIVAVPQLKSMPVVIFSLLAGSALGMVIHFGDAIRRGAKVIQKPFRKLSGSFYEELGAEEYQELLLTAIIVFCASCSGIYGTIDSGISGDHSVLFSKAILDFFAAAVFACNLGPVVSAVAIPEGIFFMVLFGASKVIYPLLNADMICNFKACGGIILLATSIRMLKLKDIQVADMIPALLIVMPVTALAGLF